MIKFKDKVENFKQEIREMKLLQHESRNRHQYLIGTLYVKEKMDYGFHIYFIHEPSETNKLAGRNGTVTEMYYDLRNQKYWIKRNLKEVKFSVRNVDSIFPRDSNQRSEIFDMLSTKHNRNLYESAFHFLGAMGEEKTEMFGRFFYRLITEYSYYELLHKAGIKVYASMYIANKNGKSPREILGISKTQWKMVSQYKIDVSYFRGINDDKADKQAINHLAYISSLEDEFGLDKIREFANNELNYLYGGRYYRSALNIIKRYNLPANKFLRYIYFECDVSQGMDSNNAIGEYSDYIRMTTEMGYERFDRYPKFLRTAHDIASRNYKVQLNEIELEEWSNQYERNKSFNYSYNGYKIFPPKEPDELVKEGNVLGHCVGSYVNKVRKGISTILFLREKEDMESPLITIEIKEDKITQARGKMNNPPSAEQKSIIKKFASKFELAY